MGDRVRFLLTALLTAGFLFLLHPAQDTFWFDNQVLVRSVSTLPLSVAGALKAIELQAHVHSSNYVRPVRAIQWWLLAHMLGVNARRMYVANVLALGFAIACLMEVGARLGANRFMVGLYFAVSYVSVYPLLYMGFGLTLAFGFAGLFAYVAGRTVLSGALVLMAALSHETMLALALVPLAHAVAFRTPRRRAYLVAGIIPAYMGLRALHASTFGSAPLWTPWAETATRVALAFGSAGLPPEPVRGLPWFPPYLRVRELLSTPLGIVTLAGACLPAAALTILACRSAPRRQVLFYGAWVAFGLLPLLLPVATPEAFHLSIALAGLFVLWASQPFSRTMLMAMVAWLALHGWARAQLFYGDLPVMAQAVAQIERARDAFRPEIADFPIQVGPHYAMLPDVGYQGCFVDPLWIWTSRSKDDREQSREAARRIVGSGTSFVRLCP